MEKTKNSNKIIFGYNREEGFETVDYAKYEYVGIDYNGRHYVAELNLGAVANEEIEGRENITTDTCNLYLLKEYRRVDGRAVLERLTDQSLIEGVLAEVRQKKVEEIAEDIVNAEEDSI